MILQTRDLDERTFETADHPTHHRLWSALHYAAAANASLVVAVLVNRGADVNLTDGSGEVAAHEVGSVIDATVGMTAAHIASQHGAHQALSALIVKKAHFISIQDEYGRFFVGDMPGLQPLTNKDLAGNTPLMYAAGNGWPNCVKVLVLHGRFDLEALLETTNNSGETALSICNGIRRDVWLQPKIVDSATTKGREECARILNRQLYRRRQRALVGTKDAIST